MKKMVTLMNKKTADNKGYTYIGVAGDIVAVSRLIDETPNGFISVHTHEKPTWNGFIETEVNFPIQQKGLGDMLTALSNGNVVADDMGVLVITNQIGYNGASALFYPGVLSSLRNYYLIPSSIHEWLAIPKSYSDVGYLKATIRQVNATQLQPDEVLSDRPYKAVFKERWTIEEA